MPWTHISFRLISGLDWWFGGKGFSTYPLQKLEGQIPKPRIQTANEGLPEQRVHFADSPFTINTPKKDTHQNRLPMSLKKRLGHEFQETPWVRMVGALVYQTLWRFAIETHSQWVCMA